MLLGMNKWFTNETMNGNWLFKRFTFNQVDRKKYTQGDEMNNTDRHPRVLTT